MAAGACSSGDEEDDEGAGGDVLPFRLATLAVAAAVAAAWAKGV